jgi:hypothetical protein
MASTSVSRSFPTLKYIVAPFRWLFGSRRQALTTIAVLLAMMAAPPSWWSIQLLGLPDIGDPFDVAAFRAMTIPDEQNAFVLYRQAGDRLKPLSASTKARDQTLAPNARWPQVHPEFRRWLEENREAMELYRRGTDRADALGLVGPVPDDPASDKMKSSLASFHRLALFEALRLEDRGDMAAAWGWYRAALRASYHMGVRGSVFARMGACARHGDLRRRLASWAADKRTTPAMLHRALDDVVACEAFTPSESYTLMAEYAWLDRALDSCHSLGRSISLGSWEAYFRSWNYRPSLEQLETPLDAWRFWRREPERGRRVIRLAIANWLAYHNLPPERRPAPDLAVTGPFDFYAFGPEAPDKARVLSPAALDGWLSTTYEARELLGFEQLRALRVNERAERRALVVSLASALYRRDHGADPPSDEALVGPYLDKLPDDGLGDGIARAGPAAKASGANATTGRE